MKFYITILILTNSLLTIAQHSFILPEVSYSTFNMSQMKSFQNSYISQSGLPLQSVTTYPSYWGYNISLGLRTGDRSSFGLTYNSTSTGGRADYEDYSGSATTDFLMSCFSIGIFHQHKINQSNSWPLYLYYSGSWIKTNMNVVESLTLGTQSQSRQTSFYSNNYGIRPALLLRKPINSFFFQLGVGYEFQFTGKLYLSDNKNAYLQNNGENVTAQWGGLRLTAGFGVILNKKKSID
jgi:hypothetical protein